MHMNPCWGLTLMAKKKSNGILIDFVVAKTRTTTGEEALTPTRPEHMGQKNHRI
jgi:hypothetical protein